MVQGAAAAPTAPAAPAAPAFAVARLVASRSALRRSWRDGIYRNEQPTGFQLTQMMNAWKTGTSLCSPVAPFASINWRSHTPSHAHARNKSWRARLRARLDERAGGDDCDHRAGWRARDEVCKYHI